MKTMVLQVSEGLAGGGEVLRKLTDFFHIFLYGSYKANGKSPSRRTKFYFWLGRASRRTKSA